MKGLHEFMLELYKEGFNQFDEWKISMVIDSMGEWSELELKVQEAPPQYVYSRLLCSLKRDDITKKFFIEQLWKSIKEIIE